MLQPNFGISVLNITRNVCLFVFIYNKELCVEEVLYMLCSLARTIRNNSLTLVKSSENRNTRRFHHITNYLCY